MRIVAGDIGGTKTLLQLVEIEADGSRRILAEERFETQEHSAFEIVLAKFLQGKGDVASACLAVAGPVVSGRAVLTNVAWDLVDESISSDFQIPKITIVNDFYAVARGVPLLGSADVVEIHRGEYDPEASIAIVGAGTGLGEAFVLPDRGRWRVIASEGGHADFGPNGAVQRELHAFLEELYGRVSYERVVSGIGLSDVYRFFVQRSGAGLPENEIPAEEIARLAAEGDARANASLDLFVDAYGAEAGNAALKVLARGGVYLAGGIAPRHLDRFRSGRFMRAFTRKGRFSDLMLQFPVRLITEHRVGLIGAADIALETAS